ncbi:MAG: dipeptidase PepE [Vicingaceae bacterium]
MTSRSLLLLSTSTMHGGAFLDYCKESVRSHFSELNEILFVPYARPSGISNDEYTKIVSECLGEWGLGVRGIHTLKNPKKDLLDYGGIYVGGGNTFLLLKSLYEFDLVKSIQTKVLSGEMKYMGSSAGTNVACPAINTTNDMPIVYPPSFNALDLIPFSINPHYLDPVQGLKHMGESRETRINEFHFHSDRKVLGLREGSWLEIEADRMNLKGTQSARLFTRGISPSEIAPDQDVSFLLKD